MVSDSRQIHNQAQALYDRYLAILALRDAEQDPDTWKRLNHAQQKAFQEWLHAQERATMHSDYDAYTDEQKLS